MRYPLGRLVAFSALCAAIVGCSSAVTLNTVEGQVTYKGNPAKGVVVVFHPEDAAKVDAIRPTGTTDDSGNFKLTCAKGTGAPVGKYKITLFWPEEAKPVAGKKVISTDTSEPDAKDRFGGRFESAAASPHQFEVKSGPNKVPTIAVD